MLGKMQICTQVAHVVVPGLLLSVGSWTSAAVVDIPAAKDAMIFGTAAGADTNNASGKGPGMFAGADGQSNRKRSLIQFDIAGAVPAGSIITDVTLKLYLGQIAGSGGGPGGGGNIPSRTFDLFTLQQDWGEGDSGSPTSPTIGGTGQGFPRVTGDSSWDYAFFDSADPATGKWNAGGPDLHGGNFSATSSASSTFTSFVVNSEYTWSSAGMVADVQGWLDVPTGNFGWLLKAMNGLNSSGQTISIEDTATSFLGFWTKDGSAANNNPAIAPVLSVTYVPEPGMIALPALLLACSARYRRR